MDRKIQSLEQELDTIHDETNGLGRKNQMLMAQVQNEEAYCIKANDAIK